MFKKREKVLKTGGLFQHMVRYKRTLKQLWRGKTLFFGSNSKFKRLEDLWSEHNRKLNVLVLQVSNGVWTAVKLPGRMNHTISKAVQSVPFLWHLLSDWICSFCSLAPTCSEAARCTNQTERATSWLTAQLEPLEEFGLSFLKNRSNLFFWTRELIWGGERWMGRVRWCDLQWSEWEVAALNLDEPVQRLEVSSSTNAG